MKIDKFFDKYFAPIIIFFTAIGLSITGFVIWVLVKLLKHWGIF